MRDVLTRPKCVQLSAECGRIFSEKLCSYKILINCFDYFIYENQISKSSIFFFQFVRESRLYQDMYVCIKMYFDQEFGSIVSILSFNLKKMSIS